MRTEPLFHPLSEIYEGRPETDGEDTMNSWALASMIANVAIGSMEGSQDAAASAAAEAIWGIRPGYDVPRLIEQAVAQDEDLLMLINLIHQGLEAKLEKAFEQ